MQNKTGKQWIVPLVPLALIIALCGGSHAQGQQTPEKAAAGPQEMADKIQAEVAEIRGLPFKRPIKAELQSTDQFGAYLDKGLEEQLPVARARNFGAVARKLGLYNGAEIADGADMMKMMMTSQAAAYYDPEKQTFFVLMPKMPEMMLGAVYAHEFYHGLQDQYFDLNRYLLNPARHGLLDADQMLARRATFSMVVAA